MPSTRRPLHLLIFFSILVVVCVLVSFLSVRFLTADHRNHNDLGGHEWIHRQLSLTDEEEARIDALEMPYRIELAHLHAEIEAQVRTLAQLLQSQSAYSPAVTDAVSNLHHVTGQLQELTIRHYFDMLSVLPAEKQDKLRKLAVNALSAPQ